MSFQVAIDGPVAAGKGTVARLVAARLGFLYVDTGAMYRTTALLGKLEGVDWDNEKGLAELLRKHSIQLRNPSETERDGRQITVLLDDKDISWEIRTEEMSKGSSIVSQYSLVRQELVRQQQAIAEKTDVVMEGRDITFRVLPKAQLKIYLDASAEVRARRRHQELLARGIDSTFESVYADLQERDTRDKGRKTDPLQVVEDAWFLDTSTLTIDEVVNLIEHKVRTIQESMK